MEQLKRQEDAMKRSSMEIAPMIIIAATLATGACDMAVGPGEAVSSDVVVAWNERVLEVAEAEDGF
jgi:hypothetical protein